MNLLFVCPNMQGGGAERVTSLIVSELSLRKHGVYLVTDTFVPMAYEINKNVKIIPLYSTNIQKRYLLKDFFSVYKLYRIMREFRPDVIVGIMPRAFCWAFLASYGTNIPVVASDHAGFSRRLGSKLDRFVVRYLYKYSNVLTVLTEVDKKILGSKIPQKVVINNPLSMQCVKKVPLKSKTILAAGRLDAWYTKGFDVLIDAWGMISSEYPEWTVKIAGDGLLENVSLLKEMIKRNKIESTFHLLGFRRDLSKLMKDSAIFVLSSREEAFGLVLIEAMSQGCACISSDSQGRQKEILSNNSGIVLSKLTKEEIAFYLKKLIDNENERLEVSSKAIEIARKYELNIIADKWEAMLLEVRKTRMC